MIDLSQRLANSHRGARLTESVIINNLLFADDLVIISQDICTMHFLLAIVENWSRDFKMSISVAKSEIISPRDAPWELFAYDEDEYLEIKSVESYKYLGVPVTRKISKTTKEMKKRMIKRAKSYSGALLRLRSTDPDKTETTINLWQAVGLSRILDGTDVVPLDPGTYQDLEKVQLSMGKSILGIRQSSADEIVATDLGLKPIRYSVYSRKLSFFFRVNDPKFKGSTILQDCMKWQISNNNTKYMEEINDIKRETGVKDQADWKQTFKEWEISQVKERMNAMKSLMGIKNPVKWWRMASYVNETEQSQVIASFRAGNAELGNRDDQMSDLGIPDAGGRILLCPLCVEADPNNLIETSKKKLNEFHIIMMCQKLTSKRTEIKISGKTLLDWLTNKPTESLEQQYRDLLNMEIKTSRDRRELATLLSTIKTEHLAKWMEMIRSRGQL
jgi:hypothetical protein